MLKKEILGNNRLTRSIVFFVTVLLFLSSTFVFDSLLPAVGTQDTSIKIGTEYLKSSLALDPARESLLPGTTLVANLYGRLVSHDQSNNITSGISSSFYWRGRDLVFRFDRKIKTVDGHLIGAEDAALSLKRAIALMPSGFNLKSFLCPSTKMFKIADPCEGIRISGDELVLTPAKSAFATSLLPLLDSPNYSIIPKNNIDLTRSNYPIISHRNTTGAYYVERDDPQGLWTLAANQNNPIFYSKEMPQRITLVEANDFNGLDLLDTGKVDLLPTFILPKPKGPDGFDGHANLYNIHQTLPVSIWLLNFTPQSVRDFSIEQRLYVGQIIANSSLKDTYVRTGQDTAQYFQGYSNASLDLEQKTEIENFRKMASHPTFEKPMRLSAAPLAYEKVKEALKEHPEIEVVRNTDYALNLPVEQRFDMYMRTANLAQSDIRNILETGFKSDFLFLPHFDFGKWMTAFNDLGDQHAQQSSLRDLHYQLLKNVIIYPVKVMPMLAIARKPWVPRFSKFRSASEFWLLRQE